MLPAACLSSPVLVRSLLLVEKTMSPPLLAWTPIAASLRPSSPHRWISSAMGKRAADLIGLSPPSALVPTPAVVRRMGDRCRSCSSSSLLPRRLALLRRLLPSLEESSPMAMDGEEDEAPNFGAPAMHFYMSLSWVIYKAVDQARVLREFYQRSDNSGNIERVDEVFDKSDPLESSSHPEQFSDYVLVVGKKSMKVVSNLLDSVGKRKQQLHVIEFQFRKYSSKVIASMGNMMFNEMGRTYSMRWGNDVSNMAAR
ncbi:hypothetical protein ACLOJK_008754 [Asimina triloba]